MMSFLKIYLDFVVIMPVFSGITEIVLITVNVEIVGWTLSGRNAKKKKKKMANQTLEEN